MKRWITMINTRESAVPLALVRILVPLVILADLFRVTQLGLVPVLWQSQEYGGMSQVVDDFSLLHLAPPWASAATLVVVALALVCTSLGVAVRPAILIAVLGYAQLGHLFPPGDRAIDRVLRSVLLILLFTDCQALTIRGANLQATCRRWGRWLMLWFLTIIYLCAAAGKLMTTPTWLGWHPHPPLYRIMADPMAGKLDPGLISGLQPLFQIGSGATIALEFSAVLLLTRFAPWWGVLGACMHLGIATTMHLGMFSWGMLALYPVVFAPWITRALRI